MTPSWVRGNNGAAESWIFPGLSVRSLMSKDRTSCKYRQLTIHGLNTKTWQLKMKMIYHSETSLQSHQPRLFRRPDKLADFHVGLWISERDHCQNHSFTACFLDRRFTFIHFVVTKPRRDSKVDLSQTMARVCIFKLPTISTMGSMFVFSSHCYICNRIMTLR